MHCFCLSSICLWTLVFPTFWLLWIVLLWTFVHLCLNIFLSEHLFSVLLGAYPGVDVARSYGNSMFNLLRFSIPAEKNLHFYQQQTRVPCFLIFFNILSTHQNLSFYGSCFWYYFKSLSLSPRSQRFSLMLASKSFIILHLTFLFIWNNFYIILIHLKQFWDVEIIWVKVLFCFVFSVYGYSIAPAPVVEKTILPPLNCFCTFYQKPVGYTCAGLFLGSLDSVPLVCVSVLLPIPNSLDGWGHTRYIRWHEVV